MEFWGWTFESASYLALAGLAAFAVLRFPTRGAPLADEAASVAANRNACVIAAVALLAMLRAVEIAVHEFQPSRCGTGIRFAKDSMRIAIVFGSPAMAFAWRTASPAGGAFTWKAVRRSACVFLGCCGFWLVLLCL